MQHSVEALTDMTLCIFPREKLWDLFTRFPALAYDVTWLAAREEQILDESLLSVGRRTAIERMAYLFLHLFTRAEEVGLTKGRHHSVSLHPAAYCRHARHVARACQQDPEEAFGDAHHALEGQGV